jgi:membrane fusion protein (multidrug efflux system)
MSRKQVIITLTVVVSGVAFYALLRFAHRSGGVEESEEAVPTLISVQTGKLKRATLHQYVTGYGTVEPAPASVNEPAAGASLAASIAGVVARVNVVEGQHVEKGDVLVEFNSGTATAAYVEQEVARQEKLYAQENTSLRSLQDAEAQLALLRVTAPLSGTITRLNAKPGAAVDVNTVVAEVIDLSRLAIKTEIPVSEAGALKSGEKVQVLTEPPLTTTLSFVSPAVDMSNSTVLTRAPLPADSGLRPGQFVQLRVVTAVHAQCLAAPAEGVVTDDSGRSLIALVNGDEATQMPVHAGLREDGWVEIEGKGLQEGDSVVTVGAYGLPEKTKIRVVNP